jgi:hypothetical protein
MYARLVNNLEAGYEERLRERIQVVLLGWCIVHAYYPMAWHQRQVRLVSVFCGACSELYLEVQIIAAGCFADFFSCYCVLSYYSTFEALNEVTQSLQLVD